MMMDDSAMLPGDGPGVVVGPVIDDDDLGLGQLLPNRFDHTTNARHFILGWNNDADLVGAYALSWRLDLGHYLLSELTPRVIVAVVRVWGKSNRSWRGGTGPTDFASSPVADGRGIEGSGLSGASGAHWNPSSHQFSGRLGKSGAALRVGVAYWP